MRIAFFSDNFYPELSGITDSILEITRELSKHGHTIRIYVPKYTKSDYKKSKQNYNEIKIDKNVTIKRLKSFSYKNSPTGQARLVIPFWDFLSDIYHFKPDIIHLHSSFSTGFDALLAAKILHKPLVGTNHTPVTEFLRYAPFKPIWLEKMSLRLVAWFYNRCDFVSAPSQTVFDEMIKYGFKSKHQVISNPIDNKAFYELKDDEKSFLKNKFGLKKNVILYTGRLAKEKNIDLIILALLDVKKKIKDTVLVITGHGAEELNLKQMVKKLKLNDAVVFVGTVDLATLIKYHQLADVFVIMSTAETQSISLMRSLAVAVPAVVANARALPEYIGTERGLIVKVGDYKSLADKIVLLLKNDKLRQTMGDNGVLFVKQISVKNVAQTWEKIYTKLVVLKKKI